jgi:mannose/cellobiose epimerase-like protein (N-acyl-D-glucosamine 2-epimerase family)
MMMSNYFGKLKRFPLGAIHAQGFLKDQMLRGKDGIAGHLYELEPGMILDPYINKTQVNSWSGHDQLGWGAEISGNYWSGYIQYAFTLNDREMMDIATDWVNKMLTNQREDGYLGTYDDPDANVYEDYNAWGTNCVMRGLIAFYEVTGREDVLDAIHKCMLWYTRVWAGDNKTSYAGPMIIEPMVFIYELTEDERLLAFAEEYAEFLCDHDIFNSSYKAFLENELHYNSNHTAAIGSMIRLPALLYSVTGKEKYANDYAEFMKYLDEKVWDHVNGSCYHQMDAENHVMLTVWPGKPDLYHALQATLIPYNAPAVSIAAAVKAACAH